MHRPNYAKRLDELERVCIHPQSAVVVSELVAMARTLLIQRDHESDRRFALLKDALDDSTR